MKSLRTYLTAGLLVVALSGPALAPAKAQTPALAPPYNTDLGAVITNTLATAQTKVTTPCGMQSPTTAACTPLSIDKSGLVCVSLWTASSGSPTEVFSIEGYDAGTASWYQIATSGTITRANGATAHSVAVHPGVAVSSLSSPNVAQSAVVPRAWRVKSVIGSDSGAAGPALTSKIGCNTIAR